jgi:hypothetical protein
MPRIIVRLTGFCPASKLFFTASQKALKVMRVFGEQIDPEPATQAFEE